MTPGSDKRAVSRESEAIAHRVVELLSNRGRTDQPFYTIDTLAAKLAISRRTVADMLRKGVIPSYKVEGSRRIDPKDVDKYLARRYEDGDGEKAA